MQHQVVLPACLLLLWTLTAFVRCKDESAAVTVTNIPGGIKLTCKGTNTTIYMGDTEKTYPLQLTYSDENTGEYKCVTHSHTTDSDENIPKIFLKFRTCDNCVELDVSSITGIVVGDLVATIVIGVAVYLIASQARIGPNISHKKSSDRQHLVPNEISNRAPNDHYQPLKHKSGQKDMYDVLTNRK